MKHCATLHIVNMYILEFICSSTCVCVISFDVLKASLESVEGSCEACASHDKAGDASYEGSVSSTGSTSCSCPDNTKQGEDSRLT